MKPYRDYVFSESLPYDGQYHADNDLHNGAPQSVTEPVIHTPTSGNRSAPKVQATLYNRLIYQLARYRQCYRSRQHLAGLRDWQLEDIGLSRQQAAREAAKPFWRE